MPEYSPEYPIPPRTRLDNGASPPAQCWDQSLVKSSLDELFNLARHYKSSGAYHELIKFIARFRWYSPFNAMLIHIQMPGATFVAPPNRWLRKYFRCIKVEARPLVILQPMGPVMFVFDVSDTEPKEGAPPLPREVEHPFEVWSGRIGGQFAQTIESAKRDGVAISERQAGSQSAGEISVAAPGNHLDFLFKKGPQPEYRRVPLRYSLLLNANHPREAKYATLVHELGHLYCGHLGTPNDKWWPDRRNLREDLCEFEAESICYLVCGRLGINNPSDEYLAQYVKNHPETPPISLDCVMRAAGLIEQMGRQRLKLRKEKESE